MHYKEITYGFEYGAACVHRLASDEKKGWVVLQVLTPKRDLTVYVTKTGKIRLYLEGEEISLS